MRRVNLPRRTFLHLATGAALLPVIPRIARAQAWPSRIVRFVNPFPPGGAFDVLGRLVGRRLSEIWGVQVIIENRPGAGGNIASQAVARSNPDGYTALLNGPAIGLNRFLFNNLPYDPIGDFAPITLLCTFTNIMAVPNSSPARTVNEFVAFAREKAGKITFAIPGVGTTQHLVGELFKRRMGIDMTAVPYRESYMNDLVTGRVDLTFGIPNVILEQHRTGRLRALAVTSANRYPLASDLPTLAESGVSDFDVSSWLAIYVPTKTPPDIVKKINADMAAVLAEPAIKAGVEQLFYLPTTSTPEQVASLLKSDMDKWGAVIKEAGIKPE